MPAPPVGMPAALPLLNVPPLEEKAPPEKTVETLFLRYLLQCFPLGEASLYAPSSREEFLNGYDAHVMGPSAFWELFLQFKRPNLTRAGFTVQLTEHQHLRLRQYPRKTAYYIAATFRTVQEVMEAQHTITNPREFLSYFIAIDLACLTDDACFIKYASTNTPTPGTPIAAAFKQGADDDPLPGQPPPPRTRQARHNLYHPCYISAVDLLDRFTSRQAGSAVILRRGRRRHPSRRVTPLDTSGNYRPERHPEVALLDLWDEDAEVREDEIRLTESVHSTLADFPEAVEERRVLILDSDNVEELFESGVDDQFSGGFGLRLPIAPWLHRPKSGGP